MLVYISHWHTHSSGKEIIVAFCNNNHVKEATNGNAHTEWMTDVWNYDVKSQSKRYVCIYVEKL